MVARSAVADLARLCQHFRAVKVLAV